MHRGRRLGIHLQAGRCRSARFDDARVAAARLNRDTPAARPRQAGVSDGMPATDATGKLPALPTRATVLIVDDEANNRFALAQVLAELEETVVEAASGEDALRFLLREECAVILLDANMP